MPVSFDVDVSGVAPAGVHTIAGDVFVPDGGTVDPGRATVVLFCVPGGGMTRRYYDLDVAPELGLGNYSMARHLATRGCVVVTLDPPGVGGSDVPDDGYTLAPHVVADVLAAAVGDVLDRLRAGKLTSGLEPLDSVVSIGVGHSMGGLLTVHQQARHRTHDAVAVLGFAGGGLPDALTDEERAFAGDAAALRREIGRLAAARFGRPFPISQTSTSPFLLGRPVPEPVERALGESRGHLIAVCGLSSMIPGNADEELAAVDVPVFIGVGTGDITGDPFRIPASFRNSRDVTLFVLDGAGHNHNAAPTRERLWDRLAAWARAVTREDPSAGQS
ncbi:MAG TPA: alpha/beta fold hydrolase [Acidimicrobiia bacterium]|nr:alpha/beta fold hydrolase [Acidimicrobiia bacterium]